MKKLIFSLVLSAAMVFTLTPAMAFAESEPGTTPTESATEVTQPEGEGDTPAEEIPTYNIKFLDLEGDMLASDYKGNIDTGNEKAVTVGAGKTTNVEARLNVAAVRDQMLRIEKIVGGDDNTQFINLLSKIITLSDMTSTFTADFEFPEDFDISGMGVELVSPEGSAGDSLYKIESITNDDDKNTISVKMVLNTPYTNYGDMHNALLGMSDYLAIEMNNVKVPNNVSNYVISGQLRGDMSTVLEKSNGEISKLPEFFQKQINNYISTNKIRITFDWGVIQTEDGLDYSLKNNTPNITKDTPIQVTIQTLPAVTFKDGESDYASVEVELGKSIDEDSLTDQSMPENPTKDGYKFVGWNTAVDGNGSVFDGQSIVNDNTIVYAQWEKLYTVTYKDGFGGKVFSDQVYKNLEKDSETPAFKGKLERSGYTFKGWDPEITDTVTKDVVYTAQWEENYVPYVPPTPKQYTVTYTDGVDGEEIFADQTTKVKEGEATPAFNGTPEREGYLFAGWDPEVAKTVTGNVTYKATWKEDTTPALNKSDHINYVVGYSDKTVRPENNITRAEVASIFFRLMKEDVRDQYKTADNNFSDVNKTDWFVTSVSTLTKAGIISGYEDGTFRPNQQITRAEFAAIASRFDKTEVDTSKSTLTDIEGSWAEESIKRAEALGYVSGYEDGTFRPDQPITRAEVMSLLNRVLHRDTVTLQTLQNRPDMLKWTDNMDTSKWYYIAVQEATNNHDEKFDSGNEEWTKVKDPIDWSKLRIEA